MFIFHKIWCTLFFCNTDFEIRDFALLPTKYFGNSLKLVKFEWWNLSKMISKLTLSWRRPLSYRNQSTDLLRKSVDWFLYDNGLRHEIFNGKFHFLCSDVEYFRRVKLAKCDKNIHYNTVIKLRKFDILKYLKHLWF